MAGKGARGLNEAMRSLALSSHTYREAASHRIPSSSTFARSMATEAPLPNITRSTATTPSQVYRPATTVPVTIFDFPSYEPQRLEAFSAKHLGLPMRRDILHQAVVYEGDNTRQGTASTKTRYQVSGSNRKVRPQKGTGQSRMGDRKSPLLRGGGKSFGPHPRDFGTRLNRKVYDLAWRTALSYRYRRGELLVCADGMDLPLPAEYLRLRDAGRLPATLQEQFRGRWAAQMLAYNEWGRHHGRSALVTASPRGSLFACVDLVPRWARALTVEDVDVKDLLEHGRIIIERAALLDLLDRHQSDLRTTVFLAGAAVPHTPVSGEVLVE
ncbi:ribosomal protein L4 [Xylariomycetidae sp. FL0641]|nr:ribosomal protein L4 [Xylariomycetidae sp. FL0641]